MATEDPKKRAAVDRMTKRGIDSGQTPSEARRRAIESAKRLDRKANSN